MNTFIWRTQKKDHTKFWKTKTVFGNQGHLVTDFLQCTLAETALKLLDGL